MNFYLQIFANLAFLAFLFWWSKSIQSAYTNLEKLLDQQKKDLLDLDQKNIDVTNSHMDKISELKQRIHKLEEKSKR